jgi:hypothetical protein
MGMTNQGLSDVIYSEIQAFFGPSTNSVILREFSDALGKAIVEYIQQNAVVTVDYVRGVRRGDEISDPGVGTIG